MLESVELGRSGVRVPIVGLGGAPMGGLFRPTSDAQAVELVERSLTLGINFFDVAPLYGSGEAERRLGLAIRGIPRESIVVSSKVGRLLRSGKPHPAWIGAPALEPVFDFSPGGILTSIDFSLRRLGLDYLDVALLHDPDDRPNDELRGAFKVLEDLRHEGVVRAIGVGTTSAETAARVAREIPVDVVLLAGRVTLLDASGLTEAVPQAVQVGATVLCGGVFNSGILASAPGSGNFDNATPDRDVLLRAERIRLTLQAHDVSVLSAAIQFPARFAGVGGILVGAHDATELTADLSAFNEAVPIAAWQDLEHAGLIPPTTVDF